MRALLQFDTRDTLNVLSLAFQEKEFSGELGQSHRQRIVNILLEIMMSDKEAVGLNYSNIIDTCIRRDYTFI